MVWLFHQGKVEWKKVDVFSRAEPEEYYRAIESTPDMIEEPYIKNGNGHCGNRINNEIKGLYLSANSAGM